MATELVERSTGAHNGHTIDAATLEKVVVHGDLSRLTPEQKLQWYNARCEAAGLDPRTQPFQYLQLQGKQTLYATKAATDQLIALHRLTVQILARSLDRDTGIYEVHCRATFPDGHSGEDIGTVFVGKAQGEMLANLYLKAVTKAKRRTVLSACGLGMLDETEVETIPDARTVPVDAITRERPQNQSGHGSGQYASPEQTDEYLTALRGWLDGKNAAWLDSWTGASGQCDLDGRNLPKSLTEPLNVHQADNHLLKWAVESGRLDHRIVPEDAKTRQLGRYVAIVFCRDKEGRKAVGKEMERYAALQLERAAEAIYRKCPDLAPQDEADDSDPDAGPLAAADAERFADDAWPEGRE